MSSRLRVLMICVVCATALAAGISPAQGYRIGGQAWPGSPAKITYFDATPSSYSWSIAQAAAAWNTSGVRVRFVRVARRSQAKVVIRRSSRIGPGSGYASVGRSPSAYIDLNMGRLDRWTYAGVVAHEFGHVLGLDHPAAGCSLMTAVTYTRCRPIWPSEAWQWRCRVLQRDDLLGARRLYGGRVRLRPSMWCEKAPKAPAPSVLTVEPLGASPDEPARITVRMPRVRAKTVRVLRRAGTCPTGANDRQAVAVGEVRGGPGVTRTLVDRAGDPLAPGTVLCYRAISYDEWGRAGASRTATIPYNPPLPPAADVLGVEQASDGFFGAASFRVAVSSPASEWLTEIRVVLKAGTACPVNGDDGVLAAVTSPGEATDTYVDVVEPGPYCVAAFSHDGYGRSSAVGATRTFTYIPPPQEEGWE